MSGPGANSAATPLDAPGELESATPLGASVPPLVVSGLVVSREDLISALRLFVPHLTDIEQSADGRFILSISAGCVHEQGES